MECLARAISTAILGIKHLVRVMIDKEFLVRAILDIEILKTYESGHYLRCNIILGQHYIMKVY